MNHLSTIGIIYIAIWTGFVIYEAGKGNISLWQIPIISVSFIIPLVIGYLAGKEDKND